MGLPDFNLRFRDIYAHLVGSRKDRDDAPRPSTPIIPAKSGPKWLRASISFTVLRSPPPRPPREIIDDTSSFASPMPKDLCSRSFDGSDIGSSESSEELYDWDNSEDTDDVRQSFADCVGIHTYFPEPPIIPQSPKTKSRQGMSCRLPSSPSFFSSPLVDRPSTPTTPETLGPRSAAESRSPTSVIRHGPLQYSTTTIPFDLLSRPRCREISSSTAPSSPKVTGLSRASSTSESTQASPVSSLAFLTRSQSCNIISRSQTPEPYPTNTRRANLQPLRLSTSISLQDLRATSPSSNLLQAPLFCRSPPSSFRLATGHIPGLEQRKPRISRGSASYRASPNPDGNHVPFGTSRF